MQPTPDKQIAALEAEITELRGKLSRTGKAGRPAICLCGHKRHAAQCPACECAEYVAEPLSGNAARKRKKQRNATK